MKQISQNKVKFFSTLLVGTISLVLVLGLSNFFTERALKNAEKNYLESCNQTLQGYSQSINWYLENYHTSLNSIYDQQLMSKESGEEIQGWLQVNTPYIHKDICILYFIDKNGMGFFSNGQVEDLSDRTYTLINGNDSNHSYFVSDIIETPFTDYPIFIIQEPVYNDEGEFRGTLCGAIKVNKLEAITEKIQIDDYCSVYLQDRNGKFLIHPDKSYIGKDFTPAAENYSHISSKVISNSQGGMAETRNEKGELVHIFYSKIDNCGWTLVLGFPQQHIKNVYAQQNNTKLLIIIISFLSLIILIFFETGIIDSFYKKQLIEADYDPLTKLWTRQRFEKEASRLLRHYPKSKFMLIEADIRGFKFINQNFGEKAADGIIYFYSKLLNEHTEERNGIIGRGFADHFYCFFKVTEIRKSMAVFRDSVNKINEAVENYDIQFFPKFGIAFYQPKEKDVTIQSLIGRASFAKSTIKENMLIQYSIYNSRLLEQINKEHYMEIEMKNSLENKEFFVMYQPKISLMTDKIVGAEALVRWYNKDLGLLTPDKFIPLFERNGFITKLDFYVYEQVFKFIEKQLIAKNTIVPISVNMSRNHSKPDKFMHDFMNLFRKFNIPPKLIQLEILERSVMDSSTLQEITNLLHKEGFTVAMDDFGSGESSLNMLTKVPIDVLKFDREFLLTATKENGSLDEKSAKFIEILIDLSKHLEKETVFEGVETQAQRDFLRSISCDQAQGYFYSKPLSERDFIEFVKQHS
ncbi:MAG: GGDEF domain-containing protein [Treponema sp.]|nr:GGDEF domain-containing protein [Treponema sp.]